MHLQTFKAYIIQVPTLTLCHNQIADRNNFIRASLNQLQYGCLVENVDDLSEMAFEFEYEDWRDLVKGIKMR